MEDFRQHTLDPQVHKAIGAALARIPSGLFIVTAYHEDRRAGMLGSWIQQVGFKPPMVSVAVAKGREILSWIGESRRFGLCQVAKDDKVLLRKFAGRTGPTEDPFVGLETVKKTVTGVPILAHCVGYLECELACHIDVDGDHDLFVGQVRNGALLTGEPYVHLRDNGFSY